MKGARENYDERKKRLHKIMCIMSISFPTAIVICIFLHWVTGNYREGYFLLALIIFFVSSYFGYYLHRRSNNLEAHFWVVSVDPDEWGPFDTFVDWLVLLAFLAIFLVSIFAK